MTKINDKERKVLTFIVDAGGDELCFSFKPIIAETALDRSEVRRACRSLAKKGLAQFTRGLMNDDGAMAGAGYGATNAGYLLINEVQEPTPSRQAASEGLNKDAALATQEAVMK